MPNKLTWTSSDTNIATIVATINANGLATGISKGTTEISTVCRGFTGSTTLTVTQAPIYLFITTPADGSTINASTTTVTGKVFGASPDTVITVNSIPATITGDAFTANNVQLTEGTNKITATATNNDGQTASQSVTVTVPPAITLSVTDPADGETITGTRTAVKGTISNWTGNETGITVNGIPATVYNGQFTANVPFTEGPNTIVDQKRKFTKHRSPPRYRRPQYMAKYKDTANNRVRFVLNGSHEKEAWSRFTYHPKDENGQTIKSINYVTFVGSPIFTSGAYNENTGWMQYGTNGLLSILPKLPINPGERYFSRYSGYNFNDIFIETPSYQALQL